MLALILLFIFGLGTAFFATQNTGIVHITFGNYVLTAIPMYVVVLVAMVFGIFVSWLISMTDAISSSLTLHGKDSALKKAHDKIEKLQEENRELSLKNARLEGHHEVEKKEENISARPSLFQNLRHSI